jgi:hypothetical protein
MTFREALSQTDKLVGQIMHDLRLNPAEAGLVAGYWMLDG